MTGGVTITQGQSSVVNGDGHLPVREGASDKMQQSTIRDVEFYIDEADCVIRVDNTLFKVSCAHLIQLLHFAAMLYVVSFSDLRLDACNRWH